MARNGKIARLSQAVREELNQQLEQGANGGEWLKWLNSLPEVPALVAEAFGGRPVGKEACPNGATVVISIGCGTTSLALDRQMIAENEAGSLAAAPTLADPGAGRIAVRYLMTVRKLVETSADGEPDFKTLRAFLQDVVAVRRDDHRATRLQMTWERRTDKRRETSGELSGNPELK